MFPGGSTGKESVCHVRDLDLVPGLGRSPGEGKDYPLQYSGLENSMDCIVQSVSQSVSSVPQSCLTLQSHGLQHARSPCPSPAPGVYSNSCPLSRWCHPTISPSVIPFSSRLQSCPASGSFQVSHFFISGGQSIRVAASASVLPVNIQDWFPLGWTD